MHAIPRGASSSRPEEQGGEGDAVERKPMGKRLQRYTGDSSAASHLVGGLHAAHLEEIVRIVAEVLDDEHRGGRGARGAPEVRRGIGGKLSQGDKLGEPRARARLRQRENSPA